MSLAMKRKAARSGTMNCPICEEKRILCEHHIHGRKILGKNKLWNRCYICSACHDFIHNGDIILEGWVGTSNGKKLMWRNKDEDKIALDGATPYIYGENKIPDLGKVLVI